jgi:hypothetical protein
MWKPEQLGEVIAERRLLLRRRGARPKGVRVRFGRPVRARQAKRGDPWWCPVEIVGLGTRPFKAVAGEDSLQALVLALELVERTLPAKAKRAGGRVEWLAERERPVFAGTFTLRIYEKALANLRSGLRIVVPLVEGSATSPAQRRKMLARINRLLETSGFQKMPLPR